MSGAISAISVAGATAAAAGAGTAGIAGAALAANAGTIALLGSSAIGAAGAISSSQASAASAGYNAKVAQNNAQIATQNANFAGAEGNQNVAVQADKTRAQIGATLANQGASGVDVNSGSAVDVRASEAKIGMMNALNIRSQAARQAYGFQTQSASDIGQAQLDRSQQSSDKTAGYLNAGTTVLGGAGKAAMYGNWLNSTDPTGLSVTTGSGAVTQGLGGLY